MRCLYREKMYFCGDYLDIDVFPVFGQKKGRSKKMHPTSEIQEKLNQANAEKKLIRLVHMNFDRNDIKLELTYSDSFHPVSKEAAMRDRENVVKSFRRLCQKKGVELKAIFTTERGRQSGRYHHHFIMSGCLSLDEIQKCWKKGYVDKYNKLQFGTDGVAGLAVYFSKKTMPGKRWSSTRNLEKPEEKERTGRISKKTVEQMYSNSDNRRLFEETYNGYMLGCVRGLFDTDPSEHEKAFGEYFCSDVKPLFNNYNGGYYISVRMYKKDTRLFSISNKTAGFL